MVLLSPRLPLVPDKPAGLTTGKPEERLSVALRYIEGIGDYIESLSRSLESYTKNLGDLVNTVFHDRGDPSAYDFQVGDLTTDGNWNDLDLSDIVDPFVNAVLLQVGVTDDAVGSTVEFRKNGNSNAIVTHPIETQVANQVRSCTRTVACDINRIIEYRTTNTTFTAINIVVAGWWK